MKTAYTDPLLGILEFPFIESHYTGKVREVYTTHDRIMVMVATNRISAFDYILPVVIPHKGAILNMIAFQFLKAAKSIVPVWAKSMPHPQVTVGDAMDDVFKVEFIVRGYNCGSFYKNYVAGNKKNPWGYTVNKEAKENARFPTPIFTPTTKEVNDTGEHDADISEKEIIEKGLMTENELATVKEYSFKLFEQGTQMAKERGLILVDTKYEFGKIDDEIYLIDEVHTPDSSRYFYADEYEERLEQGKPQKHLSKEFVREWLKEKGFEGKPGQKIPEITEAKILSIASRYMELYKAMTGEEFNPVEEKPENVAKDILKKTKPAIAKYRVQKQGPLVSIAMGSDSDLPVMEKAVEYLDIFGIPYSLDIISAHRTPNDIKEFVRNVAAAGSKVIIAGAGGAAHLPGMLSAYASLPVIGVPVKSSNSIDGWDSILSILQMPTGVPVGTMALDGAGNAALLAVAILGTSNERIQQRYIGFKVELILSVKNKRKTVGENYYGLFSS